MSVLYTNTDEAVTVTLRNPNGTPYTEIAVADTVQASLTDEDSVIGTTVTCSSATTGADWPNGIVVVTFADTETANLPTGPAGIELKITADGSGNISRMRVDNAVTIKEGFIT